MLLITEYDRDCSLSPGVADCSLLCTDPGSRPMDGCSRMDPHQDYGKKDEPPVVVREFGLHSTL